MDGPEILGPPFLEVLGNRTIDFLHQACSRNSDYAARLHELREVIEVQVVGSAAVREGIDADDRVEELGRERQGSGVGVNRKDAILDGRVPHALESLRDVVPQVGGPDLHAELAPKKDGRGAAAATQVQDAHLGPQVHPPGQPLAQPQRVGSAADARHDPLGVVGRRSGKPLQYKPLIHCHRPALLC